MRYSASTKVMYLQTIISFLIIYRFFLYFSILGEAISVQYLVNQGSNGDLLAPSHNDESGSSSPLHRPKEVIRPLLEK